MGHLFLFIHELLLIGKHLPLATATYTKMTAKGLYTIRRVFFKIQGPPFRPIFFIFKKIYIFYISGDSILNKNYFTIHSCKRFTLRSIIFYQNIFKYNRIFLFHRVKVIFIAMNLIPIII